MLIPTPFVSLIVVLLVGLASAAAGSRTTERSVTVQREVTIAPEATTAQAAAASPISTVATGPTFITGGTIITGRAETLVLHSADVLPLSRDLRLSEDQSGPLDSALANGRWPTPTGEQYNAWGRADGHRTTYQRRHLDTDSSAPVEVYSQVDVFSSVSGAQQALEAVSAERRAAPAVPLSYKRIANASFILIGANGPFVQTLVVFRKDSAVAQVLVTSYREHPPQQAAVILAHLLEERIELLGGGQ